MKRLATCLMLCGAMALAVPSELLARGPGGRGGGGGGRGGGGFSGGGARPSPSAGRSPSMSAPRPAPRPSAPAARPSAPAARPSTGAVRPGGAGGAATRPGGAGGTAGRPATGTRPGGAGAVAGSRPTASQLSNFLDIPGPSAGTRPAGGGAAGDFLQGGGAPGAARPGVSNPIAGVPGAGVGRPGVGAPGVGVPGVGVPGVGAPGVGVGRPGVGVGIGAGAGIAGGVGRPGVSNPIANNRPSRVENRQQLQDNRQQRRDELRQQVQENHPRLDFWTDHPNWAAWRINRPYRWATWAALTGWCSGYGWSEPASYGYGEDVYYQDDQVYSGGQPVATAEEYTQQAADIVAAAPETTPADAEWLPLGVFALTQDGEASGADPTMFLQLAISKEGIIGGNLNNAATGQTQEIEGMADKASQRAAWTVKGQQRPIMETGIVNFTKDVAPALLHFADGQTQQWLLVRLEEPKEGAAPKAPAAPAAAPPVVVPPSVPPAK